MVPTAQNPIRDTDDEEFDSDSDDYGAGIERELVLKWAG
jgi:hypothetical protein